MSNKDLIERFDCVEHFKNRTKGPLYSGDKEFIESIEMLLAVATANKASPSLPPINSDYRTTPNATIDCNPTSPRSITISWSTYDELVLESEHTEEEVYRYEINNEAYSAQLIYFGEHFALRIDRYWQTSPSSNDLDDCRATCPDLDLSDSLEIRECYVPRKRKYTLDYISKKDFGLMGSEFSPSNPFRNK